MSFQPGGPYLSAAKGPGGVFPAGPRPGTPGGRSRSTAQAAPSSSSARMAKVQCRACPFSCTLLPHSSSRVPHWTQRPRCPPRRWPGRRAGGGKDRGPRGGVLRMHPGWIGVASCRGRAAATVWVRRSLGDRDGTSASACRGWEKVAKPRDWTGITPPLGARIAGHQQVRSRCLARVWGGAAGSELGGSPGPLTGAG